MYLDALKQIQSLEQSLSEEKAAARVKAQAAEEDARNRGLALLEETRRAVRAADGEAAKTQEERAEALRQEVLDQAQGECEALRRKASERMEQAAALIVGKVVER